MKVLGFLIAGALAIMSQSATASVIFKPADTTHAALQSWGRARVMPALDQPFTGQPTQFGGGVTYRSTNDSGVIGYSGGYGFADNGAWSGDPQSGGSPMAGLNAAVGAMTFDFASPVSAVIAEMNWATGFSTGEPIFMSVFNFEGDLLETFEFTGLVGQELGTGFFGFDRGGSSDISRLVLSNGYIGARNFHTQEIVGFGGGGGGNASEEYRRPVVQAPVPEPGTWTLVIVGFGLLGATLRSGRRPREA